VKTRIMAHFGRHFWLWGAGCQKILA